MFSSDVNKIKNNHKEWLLMLGKLLFTQLGKYTTFYYFMTYFCSVHTYVMCHQTMVSMSIHRVMTHHLSLTHTYDAQQLYQCISAYLLCTISYIASIPLVMYGTLCNFVAVQYVHFEIEKHISKKVIAEYLYSPESIAMVVSSWSSIYASMLLLSLAVTDHCTWYYCWWWW